MTWAFVENGHRRFAVLGWVVPIVIVVAYFYLPAQLDLVVLVLGAIFSMRLLDRNRSGWQRAAAIAWCVAPLGVVRVEAMLFELRVEQHLADFDIAAQTILAGKAGPCWGTIRTPADCDLRSMSPIVQTMVVAVRNDKESVKFEFEKGFRRGLLYAPKQPAKQLGPYHPIAPGWFLSVV